MTALSANGIALIKEFEGLHDVQADGLVHAYLCPAGVWTIGYGTTNNGLRPIRSDDVCTKGCANGFLTLDCRSGNDKLEDTIPYWSQMHIDMQGALLSFGYNLGYGFYGAKNFDTITACLRDKDWREVPEALKLYNQPPSATAGLNRRRAAEGALWQQGLDQITTSPEPAPMTYTVGDCLNAVRYFDELEHQVEAFEEHFQVVGEPARQTFLDAYRNDPEPAPTPTLPSSGLVLDVPYFSQIDNASGEGYRECFSSSCAMVAAYFGKVSTDDEYNRIRQGYGDTTSAEAQVQTLQSLGLHASMRYDGTRQRILDLLAEELPIVPGWFHQGPVTSPTGGGHYSVVIGHDPTTDTFIHHDPNGEANLVPGGYVHVNTWTQSYGEAQRYSWKNWGPRFDARPSGQGLGWYLEIRP